MPFISRRPTQIVSQRNKRFLRTDKSAFFAYDLNISAFRACGRVKLHSKFVGMQYAFITFAILNMETIRTNSNGIFSTRAGAGRYRMPFTVCVTDCRKNGLFQKSLIADQAMLSFGQSFRSASRSHSGICDLNMRMTGGEMNGN